ncbi:hypothetical protein [Halorubrum ezzemoulense]|jgi:hypothetical protein|uniref:Acyl-CoA dehydrogenase n=1 Tax=Halorubrum ezzemoulense TaxID=337243 RepID=A0A256JNT1_HALEZ|nr:hypothetical protein [Halorubrum ezzemoulense]OYR69877.1 hypothetical protein DJ78_10330 [Halorubrum ezzemoulense]
MGGDSFKSGSGNLNFGDEEEEADDEPEKPDDIANEEADDQEPEVATSAEVEESRTSRRTKNTNSPSEKSTTTTPPASDTEAHQYPYFVRRSNVGDERDNRLEIFARDEVVSREAEFRSRLATELGADDIAKTDAREYALLAAFNNVKHVAELMRGDGYGELD